MANTENSKTQVRLGVSPLSWTNDVLADLGGDVPLEVCLKDAAEIGYEGVELGRKFPKDPRSVVTQALGIRAPIGRWLVLRVPGGAAAGFRMECGCGPHSIAEGVRLSRYSSTESAGKRPDGFILGSAPESEPGSKVN